MSVESSAALHKIATGALAYPFVDGVPRPNDIGAMAVLMLGWLAGLCLILGLLPDVMAGLGALTCAATLLWDQQMYSSHLLLLTVVLALLSFAESDRRWAVSRGRYKAADGVPYWPQLLMMSQASVVYLFAGLSKAQPTFLSGEPLAGWLWLDLPGWAFVALAYLTVVTEITLAFALWVPRLRVGAVAVGLALHLSIVTMLESQTPWLIAFTLTTTAAYPLFLTRPSFRQVLQTRFSAASPTSSAEHRAAV